MSLLLRGAAGSSVDCTGVYEDRLTRIPRAGDSPSGSCASTRPTRASDPVFATSGPRVVDRRSAAAAAVDSDRDAVVFPEERETYGGLEARAHSLARSLRGVGVERGDSVALFMPNCLDYVAALLAIAKLGAVGVPINGRFKAFDQSRHRGFRQPRAAHLERELRLIRRVPARPRRGVPESRRARSGATRARCGARDANDHRSRWARDTRDPRPGRLRRGRGHQ